MSEAAVTIYESAAGPVERVNVAEGHALTPMAMLSQAIDRGASMEMLEKLMALQERWEASQARKAFDAALASAKAEIPVIVKNRLVDFPTDGGRSRTSYRHEDLGEIARTVDPILAKHGLSYRFRTTSEINQPIVVSCIVAHRDGHSETNTLTAGRDDSGKKNLIQQMGSTITYLQRYTLKAALGLAAAADDDGRASESPDLISDEEAERVQTLIVETKANVSAFLRTFGVESVADLSKKDAGRALDMLEAKKYHQQQREDRA